MHMQLKTSFKWGGDKSLEGVNVPEMQKMVNPTSYKNDRMFSGPKSFLNSTI